MKAITAEEVREFFRKRDIDFVGIAPVEGHLDADVYMSALLAKISPPLLNPTNWPAAERKNLRGIG